MRRRIRARSISIWRENWRRRESFIWQRTVGAYEDILIHALPRDWIAAGCCDLVFKALFLKE